MCGIFGYYGLNDNATHIILEGLRKLEYRGYDSWGIAWKEGSEIVIKKAIGRIPAEITHSKANIAIGHTRWATHGGVTEKNAHPHKTENVVVVHNGIIENFQDLQSDFSLVPTSETDSEILAHLIEHHLKTNSFAKAVKLTLQIVRGTYALAALNTKTDELIVARKGSPLVIGLGEDEVFVASDVPALIEHTRKVIYLHDGQYAIIGKRLVVKNLIDEEIIEPVIKNMEWSVEKSEKGGYEHFMLKEIMEQPHVLIDTLQGRVENDLPNFPELENISEVKRIIIVACGTSWHSALVGEFLLEGLAKIPVEVEYASEFRYRNPIIEKETLVIAISQSGETADTLAALREAKKKGAKVLSICNVMDSTIPRESDVVLYTRAGPEIGVASTKAFLTQVVVLYLLTAYYAHKKETLPIEKVKEMLEDIKLLPKQLEDLLDGLDLKSLAKKYVKKNNALFLGRGIHFPIALEGALKLKEVSYIHAEGYPAAEMKHGPIALIDEHMPTVVIATHDEETYEKVLGNIQEIKARGGEVIAIATLGDKKIEKLANQVIYIPETRYSLSSLLAVIPLQLFAYHVAVLRDCDVDKPRNLAKSVTVE